VASVAQRSTDRSALGKTCRIPIIADAGTRAWVVLLPLATAPEVGDTFHFRGVEWVIVRRGDATRGFVAHPRHPHTQPV